MKILLISFLSLFVAQCSKISQELLTMANGVGSVTTTPTAPQLTNAEVISGLKEALQIGIKNAVNQSAVVDGFLGNAQIRLPFPPDALKVKEKSLQLGMTNQVEQFETTLNRAAEEAVKEASRILIQHLMIITDENISLDNKKEERENVVDEETLQLRKILGTPLEDLELSVRAFNCLKAAKINSLSELVNYTQDELMKFRNFGQKSLSEIEQVLHERGLHFGMDISRLKSLSKDF
jgi:hypothetical protein